MLGILAFAKVYNKDNFQTSSPTRFCVPCSTTNADGTTFTDPDGANVQCQNVGDWLNSTGGIESLTKAMNSKGGIESLTSALKKIDKTETFNFNLGKWSEPIKINGITMAPSSTNRGLGFISFHAPTGTGPINATVYGCVHSKCDR